MSGDSSQMILFVHKYLVFLVVTKYFKAGEPCSPDCDQRNPRIFWRRDGEYHTRSPLLSQVFVITNVTIISSHQSHHPVNDHNRSWSTEWSWSTTRTATLEPTRVLIVKPRSADPLSGTSRYLSVIFLSEWPSWRWEKQWPWKLKQWNQIFFFQRTISAARFPLAQSRDQICR